MRASRSAITAVVLAGGEAGDRMAADAGVEAKALVPVAGKPMGAYVLEALRGCAPVGRIVYVGPVNVRLRGLYDVSVPGGRRLVDSLALGAGAALALAPEARLLVLTADIPWVTSDGLAALIEAVPDADLVYPAVTEAASSAQFPHQRRTFARLREGRLTGGNAVLIAPAAVPKLLPLLDAVGQCPVGMPAWDGDTWRPESVDKIARRCASLPLDQIAADRSQHAEAASRFRRDLNRITSGRNRIARWLFGG